LLVLLIFSEASGAGAVTTLAFLVLFRVLIKLFFSIDMVHSLQTLNFLTPCQTPDAEQDVCQTDGGEEVEE
jgi:hypothetical protein